MGDDESICQICNEQKHNLDHNNTVNHRFQFKKFEYNKCRKSLLSNRHGVVLSAEVQKINNFHFDFQEIKGKYVTKVTPEQLSLHKSSLTFKCTITNTRRDSIYIISSDLIHESSNFTISHPNKFGEEESTFLHLHPGKRYAFDVTFTRQVPTCDSYKIPLSCDFQTDDDKKDRFTIIRTFLVIVDDKSDRTEQKTKSPFTSQPWKEVTTTRPTTKDTKYKDCYQVPGKYRKLLVYGLTRFSNMNVNDDNNFMELSRLLEQLTKNNYNKFWHILLWMEEIGQALMLTKYNMQKVTMQIKKRDILELEVPGLAEKRPSVVVGDFIRIRLTGDHTAYKGFVCQVNDKTIEISHVDEELLDYLQKYPTSELDVSFMLGRLAFERMHHAVDTLVRTRVVQKLFPPKLVAVRNHTSHKLDNSQFFNKLICDNAEQRNAVDKILNSVQDLPYIVFGPPGTGKTVTIVEAILQIKKRTKKKILVCAPANAACDMLAQKLIPHCNTEELIRIHSSTRDRTSIPEELLNYSNVEDDEFTQIKPDRILSYRIVVTTLVLIGRFSGSYHPDCVFVDEAAQASEPEADIAIALVDHGKQIVLAGDPEQLGPSSTQAAEKFGLGTSLLKRLMEHDLYKINPDTGTHNSNFITMLRLNFRSHPDILSIPNELFYNNLLKAQSQTAQKDPIVEIAIFPTFAKKPRKVKGCAVEFYSVSAKEKREGSSPSFFNLSEAKTVVKYVRALRSLNLDDPHKVRLDEIGVVTPYKRQVYKIKELLKHGGVEGVEVGTTESFQGREKRIIIISTVRAQHSLLLHDRKYNLGFVKHDQRFNVAVTRAISKLIVIGCPVVLRTDSKWEQFMNLCHSYGTYFGNSFPAFGDGFKKDVLARTRNFKAEDDQYNHP